jgi:hypothetical protein
VFMRNIIAVGLIAALAVSCASKADSISASYVSPTLYNNLSCAQLADEAQAVSSRAAIAAGVQDKKAGQDAALTTVGIVLFWPALFFNSGDGASAAEVARLKGEMQAVEDASRRKGCGLKFSSAPAKQAAPKK